MLEDALRLLSTLVSEHSAKPRTEGVMDSAIQTSPEMKQPISNILQSKRLEGTQLTCTSHNIKQPQDHSQVSGRRKFTLRGQRRRKKRPLVLPQRSKCTVLDENSHPVNTFNKLQSLSSPLHEYCDQDSGTNKPSLSSDSLMPLNRGSRSSKASRCLITPLRCWSQDSSGSECLTAIEPILEKLAESKMGTPVKPGGLWQLFESES